MKVHEWQKIEARKKKPAWYGDLNCDCTAHWAGLTLRAEWVQDDDIGPIWWWAVSDDESGEEVDSSNNHLPITIIRSGIDARHRAEMTAYRWIDDISKRTENE